MLLIYFNLNQHFFIQCKVKSTLIKREYFSEYWKRHAIVHLGYDRVEISTLLDNSLSHISSSLSLSFEIMLIWSLASVSADIESCTTLDISHGSSLGLDWFLGIELTKKPVYF